MEVKVTGSQYIHEEYAKDICCALFDTQLLLLQRNTLYRLYNLSMTWRSRSLVHSTYMKSMPIPFTVHGLTLSYHRCRETLYRLYNYDRVRTGLKRT